MKIVHLNNFDIVGGAARACYSIHNSLLQNNIQSRLLVQNKVSQEPTVNSIVNNSFEKGSRFIRKVIDYSATKLLCNEEYGRFSFPIFSPSIVDHPLIRNSDLINLHWINEGFISLGSLKKLAELNIPIVWTLHDMWAFTGGCHYTNDCKNYISGCSHCPALKIKGERDFSNSISKKKKEVFNNINLSIVTSSNWLGEEAESSLLLKDKKVYVAPTAIDTEIFRPRDKKKCKEELNLNKEKLNVLFGTMNLSDKRKGMHHLIAALEIFNKKYPEYRDKVEFSVFGSLKNSTAIDLSFKLNFLGHKSSNEQIAKCYNAADLFVAPSIQDNLPNTVLESLGCGTPVAAFNIGGMPDMIEHKKNGYLAKPFSADDLADGIKWTLQNCSLSDELNVFARQKAVSNYTFELVGQKYIKIYNEILKMS
jgi:glycosyltransferase involved in cell wall biosynthesis